MIDKFIHMKDERDLIKAIGTTALYIGGFFIMGYIMYGIYLIFLGILAGIFFGLTYLIN